MEMLYLCINDEKDAPFPLRHPPYVFDRPCQFDMGGLYGCDAFLFSKNALP
jgi:hypothetical protein